MTSSDLTEAPEGNPATLRDSLMRIFRDWDTALVRRNQTSFDDLVERLLKAGWRPAYDGKAEVYRDDAGEYRWRLTAANGQTVAGPGEGYTSREHAARMARLVTGLKPEGDQ